METIIILCLAIINLVLWFFTYLGDGVRVMYVALSLLEMFGIRLCMDDPSSIKPWCLALCGIIFLIQGIVSIIVAAKTDLWDVKAEAGVYTFMTFIGCAISLCYYFIC